jgi:hypothetical protein
MYIITSIEIGATPQKIWEILTNLEKISDWNPLINNVKGNLKSGKKLSISLQLSDSINIKYRPYVQKAERFSEIRCLSYMLFPGILDSEYTLALMPIDEKRTFLLQAEKFEGILLPIIWVEIETKLKSGLQKMNQALKRKAETSN